MAGSKTSLSDLDLLGDGELDDDLLDKPIGSSFADALSDETLDAPNMDEEAMDVVDLDAPGEIPDLDADLDALLSADEPADAIVDAAPEALDVDEVADADPINATSMADGLLAELEADVAASAREIGETSTTPDYDLEDVLDPPPPAGEADETVEDELWRSADTELPAEEALVEPEAADTDLADHTDVADITEVAEVEDPPLADLDDAPLDAAGAGLGFEYDFGDANVGDRPVPRITIHAYCMRPATQTLLQSAGADRRMSNATMEVLTGGVEAAVQRYTAESTPNLIILECTKDARTVLAELDALAEHCDEGVKVIVIGLANDIRLYRELMRRGVSEYLVPPLEPVQLIRAISSLFVDPDQPFLGRNIAVCGVKGGVGASTIAHNFAWSVAERLEQNATLVDLDLNFGTTGLDFNEEAAQSVADALMSPDRFDEAVLDRLISKATDHLSLFTAPATLDRTYDLDPEVYTAVLEQVRKSVPFVILDMPHIWTDWFKGTIVGADDIVVVAGPDLASLRNGKNLIDFLKAARPNDSEPHLVLNMVGVPKRPEIPVKDFAQAIDMEPSLVLPFEPQTFGLAANNGQMIADVAPDSKCTQGIDHLASTITGREMQTGSTSILSKLFKR